MAVIASFVAATARVSDARGAPTNIANSLANNTEAYNIHVTADDIKTFCSGPLPTVYKSNFDVLRKGMYGDMAMC
jgi:hypothetical protein